MSGGEPDAAVVQQSQWYERRAGHIEKGEDKLQTTEDLCVCLSLTTASDLQRAMATDLLLLLKCHTGSSRPTNSDSYTEGNAGKPGS